MRVIIAGSRGIVDESRLNRAILNAQIDITHVISPHRDTPDGIEDSVADMVFRWAKLQDPVVPFLAYPIQTTPQRRNCQMVKDGEARGLIALWDGKSSGTRHMICEAVGAGLVHYIDAACPHCGSLQDVGIYEVEQGEDVTLRASCRPCLAARLAAKSYGAEALSYFDLLGIWGKHTLHITVARRKEQAPKIPLPLPPRAVTEKLVFGQPIRKERKRIKPLKAAVGAPTLY